MSGCPLASLSLRICSFFVCAFSHSGCPNEEGLVSGGLVVWYWAPWHENTTTLLLFCAPDVIVLTAILCFDYLEGLILVQNKLP